ncbi:MAG: hotdog fold thioesterase [Nitriliruptorales bacterium]|nr:hotdog fold thioesterase [Nitriliruptorales bacterium]
MATEMPLRAELDAVLRASPALADRSIVLERWWPGGARTRLKTVPAQGNLAGTVHGGALLTLADAAFEAACNGYGRRCVALELSCHFVSAAHPGEELVAEATEISRSRRTASYRIEVCGGDPPRLRVVCMALAYRTARWHLGEEGWPAAWVAQH